MWCEPCCHEGDVYASQRKDRPAILVDKLCSNFTSPSRSKVEEMDDSGETVGESDIYSATHTHTDMAGGCVKLIRWATCWTAVWMEK